MAAIKVNVSKLRKTFSFETNKMCIIDVIYESYVKTEPFSDVVRTSIVQLTFINLKILLVLSKSSNQVVPIYFLYTTVVG